MNRESNKPQGANKLFTSIWYQKFFLLITCMIGFLNIHAETGKNHTPFIIVCSVMGFMILLGVGSIFWKNSKQ